MEYNKICILDTETTSIYWNSAVPLQIAAEICDKYLNVIDTFNEKIKTNRPIPPDASAVNGIYAKDLVNCRSEKEVLADFILWLADNEVDVILTYNGEAFDRPMLNKRLTTLYLPDVPYFDKTRFPGIDGKNYVMRAKRENLYGLKDALGRGWKLSKVAELMSINNEGAHDALVDVEMLRKIVKKLDQIYYPEQWEGQDNIEQSNMIKTSLF